MTSEQVRWIVLAAGIACLAYGWFMSDEGMARSQRNQRRLQAEQDFGEDVGGWLHGDRDPNAREIVRGGIARWQLLLSGAVLILVWLFWQPLARFLGRYFTPV